MDETTLRFAVRYDPAKPNEFFDEIDRLAIRLIEITKFITPARAMEILESTEVAKREMIAKIEATYPPLSSSID